MKRKHWTADPKKLKAAIRKRKLIAKAKRTMRTAAPKKLDIHPKHPGRKPDLRAQVNAAIKLAQGLEAEKNTALEQLLQERLRHPVFVWRAADGRDLVPSQMDEGHLRNTVCYLQRRLTAQFGHVRYLRQTTYHVQALFEMLKECERRGIDV